MATNKKKTAVVEGSATITEKTPVLQEEFVIPKDTSDEIFDIAEEKIVEEKSKKKNTYTMMAKVNYIKDDKTSISYVTGEKTYGAFVDGLYKDNVEIEFENNKGIIKIINVKQK